MICALRPLIVFAICLGLAACRSHPPLETVEKVDIERFMGNWYIIANIPTSPERGAHNAIESYRLDGDIIRTRFTFNKDGFDGEQKEYTPNGFVTDDPSNAVWKMQFVWPFKADYRIIWLDHDYNVTVIGRNKRDYVWIMAREPQIPVEKFQKLASFIEQVGYDVAQLEMVPQQWP